MKKYLSLFAAALLTLGFAACSDVPAPYSISDEDINIPVQPSAGAEGEGTAESPFNSVAANDLGKTLAQGEVTTDVYYIKGYIVSIKEEYTTNYGNATFYISTDANDATNQFYVFRALYLGNKNYAAGQTQIKVGDEVVICGKITNYNGTIETQQKEAYLVSLNGTGGNTDPGDITGESITVEAASLGVANTGELSSYNLNEGIAWSFAQNDGTTSPKYYNVDKTARLYAQNSVTVASTTGRKIKAIIFNVPPEYQGTVYVGNSQMSASVGSVHQDTNAKTVTVSNINAAEVTVTNAFTENKGGVQFRIVSMTVVFEDGTVATIRRR